MSDSNGHLSPSSKDNGNGIRLNRYLQSGFGAVIIGVLGWCGAELRAWRVESHQARIESQQFAERAHQQFLERDRADRAHEAERTLQLARAIEGLAAEVRSQSRSRQ